MPVQHIHTYLVHPQKGNAAPPAIIGTSVPLNGKLFELLNSIYERSDQECDIDITFRPADDGTQQNDCRDLVCGYLADPTLPIGRAILNLSLDILATI